MHRLFFFSGCGQGAASCKRVIDLSDFVFFFPFSLGSFASPLVTFIIMSCPVSWGNSHAKETSSASNEAPDAKASTASTGLYAACYTQTSIALPAFFSSARSHASAQARNRVGPPSQVNQVHGRKTHSQRMVSQQWWCNPTSLRLAQVGGLVERLRLRRLY